MARKTAVRKPAKPHFLANFETFRLITEVRYRARDLVAGDEWVFRHAPLVIQHRKVGMAEATVIDFDFNLLRTKVSRDVAEWFERPFGGFGGVCVVCDHIFLGLNVTVSIESY